MSRQAKVLVLGVIAIVLAFAIVASYAANNMAAAGEVSMPTPGQTAMPTPGTPTLAPPVGDNQLQPVPDQNTQNPAQAQPQDVKRFRGKQIYRHNQRRDVIKSKEVTVLQKPRCCECAPQAKKECVKAEAKTCCKCKVRSRDCKCADCKCTNCCETIKVKAKVSQHWWSSAVLGTLHFTGRLVNWAVWF